MTRETEVPYTTEEVGKIREALKKGVSPMLCPRCGTKLIEGAPAGGGTVGFYFAFRCDNCKRGLSVSALR
jgi:hypothetical protein